MEINSSDIIGRLSFGGDVHNLKTGSYLIGNSSSKDYDHDIGVEDPSLDVKHAVIVVSHESTRLMDLFSRHGTYIDGKRVKQFEIIELTKPVKLQFGCVISHYQPSYESDSGFLGLNDSTGRDTSIIPNTPPNRRDSLTPLTAQNVDRNDSIIVKATQAPNEYALSCNTSGARRSNLSHFEEDDDFFIPETQEVNFKNISAGKPEDELELNDSCDMFQLNTQDFNEPNDCSNDSDDLIAHVSYQSAIAEPVKQSPSTEKAASSDQSGRNDINDGSDTDCEEEILNLRLDDTNKSGKSVGETSKDVDSAPSTPDLHLNPVEEVENNDFLEPTQAFINPNLSGNIKINQNRPSIPNNNETAKSYTELDMTQAFVVPAASTSKINEENLNDSESLEQTQIFQPLPQKSPHTFSTPCIAQFDKIRKSAKKAPIIRKATEDIEPTQIFRPPDIGETSIEKLSASSDVANDLEATQKFIVSNASTINSRRKSQSPVLLDTDDEDDNSEYCFAETLVVGEEPKKSGTLNTNSSSKKAKIMNKLFGSDDENENKLEEQTPQNRSKSKSSLNLNKGEIQPTPDFAFFKLPGVKKLDVADAIYRAKFNSMVRCKTLLEESSDEEDENDHVKVLNRLLNESEIPLAALKEVKNKSSEMKDVAKKVKRNSRDGSSSSSATVSNDKSDKTKSHAKLKTNTKRSSESKKSEQSKKKDKESKKSEHKRRLSPTKNETKEKQHKASKLSVGENERSDVDKKKSEPESKNDKESNQKDTQKKHERSEAGSSKEDKKEKAKSDKDHSNNHRKHHKSHHHSDRKRTHKEHKETDENMPTNKLGEFRTSNADSHIDIKHCKVLLQRSEHDILLENVNNEKNKKRGHNSSKDESTVPKKKSKENDPKCIQSVINGDVIVPLRKSSRSMKPRILFTKMDSKPHEKLIEKIGGKIVTSPYDCNILVTDMIYRTWKFLSAMAKGIPIVTIKWLDEALAYKEKNDGSMPNFDNFLVKDPESEIRFKFTLKKSLERARHSLIFNGYTFYCTPNTKPVPKELHIIIECAGGKVVKKISKEFIKTEKFYVVSDKRDIALWLDIRSEIGDVCILSAEAVLIAVMQQSINFKMYMLAS